MGMAYYVGYYGTTLLILVGYLAIVFFLLKRVAKYLPKTKIKVPIPNWQRNPKRQTATENFVYVIKLYAPESYDPETQADDAIEIPQQTRPFLPEGGKGTIINAAVVAPGKPYPDEAGVEVVYAGNGSYRTKN